MGCEMDFAIVFSNLHFHFSNSRFTLVAEHNKTAQTLHSTALTEVIAILLCYIVHSVALIVSTPYTVQPHGANSRVEDFQSCFIAALGEKLNS